MIVAVHYATPRTLLVRCKSHKQYCKDTTAQKSTEGSQEGSIEGKLYSLNPVELHVWSARDSAGAMLFMTIATMPH